MGAHEVGTLKELTERRAILDRLDFRIGVHIGDMMVRAGDLFGDGVNITARSNRPLKVVAARGSID